MVHTEKMASTVVSLLGVTSMLQTKLGITRVIKASIKQWFMGTACETRIWSVALCGSVRCGLTEGKGEAKGVFRENP